MHKEILVDTSHGEVRIAVVENGKLVELHLEQEGGARYAGDIYKGRVEDVLPGLGSAFVDIGRAKRAFLHASDVVLTGAEDVNELFGAREVTPPAPAPHTSIRDVLRRGQDVIVQVVKESIGDKGAKLTTAITIPGRYLVFMPYSDRVNISARIADADEWERLRQIVEDARPRRHGFIVRTAAQDARAEQIQPEVQELAEIWRRIVTQAGRRPAPALLYQDKDLLGRVLRDQFTADVDILIVDSLAAYERVSALAGKYAPSLISRVRLYDDDHPIFDAFGVEAEIDRMFRRRIWLRSGGYIVIDEAEALVAIDVNTGRFLGRENQEETILKTNVEAAAEIARQVRLRNIGGIIIIDFIDMTVAENKRRVLAELREHMARDRARCRILELSELGMVEMTRQRQRGSLAATMSRPCPFCHGRGTVLDFDALGRKLERELDRRFHAAGGDEITVVVHPQLKGYLETTFAGRLSRLELEHGGHVRLEPREDFALDAVEILGNGRKTHPYEE